MKHASYSLIHIAVIAAVAATVVPAHAKFVLEGQNIDLTETTYNKDIIGGQYIKADKPYDDETYYYGPNRKPLYDKLQNFETTTIYLRKGQTVKEEVIGGTYLHGGDGGLEGERQFHIGQTNIVLDGGSVGQNIFGGNKFNTNNQAIFNASINEVTIDLRNGAKVTGAVYAGSSMKSQLNKNVSKINDHIKAVTLNVTDSEVGGVVAGTFMQSAAVGKGANVHGLIDVSKVTISGSTVDKLTYEGMNGSNVVPEYSMNVSGSVYGGGLVLNGNNGESFINKVGQSDIRILDGSTIKGHVVAGGLIFLGKDAQKEGSSSATEVGDVKLTVADSHLEGDVILGSQVVHQFAGDPKQYSTTLGSTELALHNAKIDGVIRGQDLIVDGSSTAGNDVLTYQANTAKKSLVASGANVVGGISEVSTITLNASKDNVGDKGQAVLTVKGGTADLQDTVITVNGGLDVGAQNVRLMALADNAKVVGDNTKIVGKGVFVDQVWQAQNQAELEALFNKEGTLGSQGLDFKPTLNTNAQTLSDVRLGTLAFINQGAEFIADEGLTSMRRAATAGSATGFAAMHGGWSKYSTGSDVELKGMALVVGTATQLNDFTVGAFAEVGTGSSDVGEGASTADGDHRYYGLGLGAVWAPDDHWHVDGAVRLGQGKTEYKGFLEGNRANYDSDSFYASMHVGAGYQWMLTERLSADVYGRYALGYIDGDDLTIDDPDRSRLHMEEAWTHTVRLGARVGGLLDQSALRWTVGVAYEHVFDGDSESAVQDIALRTPSLEGDAGIVEVMFGRTPATVGQWGWGVGLKGYVGDRKGVLGEANLQYAF